MREVTIAELATVVRVGGTVVDVREPDEYAAGHVPGARSVPMGRLPGAAHDFERGAPILVVCASGNRSAAVTDYLTTVGFNAASVAGGTAAWISAGHPVDYGPPAPADPVGALEPDHSASTSADGRSVQR